MPSGTLSTVKNDDIFLCFATGTYSDILASWFFIHLYRKSVTSNTFQFRDDSESKSAINQTFCGHRLHWFKRRFKKIKNDLLFSNAEWNYNREREKSKYLNNISVLPTSVFIFDKFVDGAQPEVAGDIGGRRHIFRTLLEWVRSWVRDWSDHTNYTISIGCFSTKHAELRSKSKDWLARNQNNVSEWVNRL
jgi:hypothetical protein